MVITDVNHVGRVEQRRHEVPDAEHKMVVAASCSTGSATRT